MNGFELFREIRIDEKVKVCFMTSFEVYFKAVKEEHPTLDMDCIIKKPVSMKNLLNKLKTELMKPNHFKIETSYYEDKSGIITKVPGIGFIKKNIHLHDPESINILKISFVDVQQGDGMVIQTLF
jgi:hypothetical protein